MHFEGKNLWRIKAVKDFGYVKTGDLGGWTEKEERFSQEGGCWVDDEAKVFGSATAYGLTKIFDTASVCEEATVYGSTVICEEAQVSGGAVVCMDAIIFGRALIYGNAYVAGNMRIGAEAEVGRSVYRG